MIIDIHAHYVPERFFAFAKRHDGYAIRTLKDEADTLDLSIRDTFYGLNRTFFDTRRQIERMQGLGIDRTIVSLATPFVNYYVDGADALAAARICNDGFGELVASDRDHFGAWAYLPVQAPREAATELRRCVRDLGFVGGHIATNVRGRYLPDENYEPIVRAALDLDVPLFVHPADPAGRDRTGDYELTVVAGYPFDSTINILRMVCSGFLDRHPSLKLVCAHTGAFSLMLRARMQREVDTNPQLSNVLPRPVGEYLAQLYFDSICFEPGYLRFATSIVPVERILLGSDGPFPLGEPDPVGFVRTALPEGEAAKVLGGNAAVLFR
jgi:aminocarboxymuconate-semialdehyde decarboxylase